MEKSMSILLESECVQWSLLVGFRLVSVPVDRGCVV